MKFLNYIILSLILLSIWSCNSDTKSSDKNYPRISEIRFNQHDTIIYDKKTLDNGRVDYKILILNDSVKKDYAIPDTLVIGHPITFRGHFEDDEDGLSAVVINIWGDTLLINNQYIYYRLKNKVPNANMFGKSSYTMYWQQLESTLPSSISSGGLKEILTSIKAQEINSGQGENAGYFFSVFCIDAAGNENQVSYQKKTIYILTREQVLKARGIEEAIVEEEGGDEEIEE